MIKKIQTGIRPLLLKATSLQCYLKLQVSVIYLGLLAWTVGGVGDNLGTFERSEDTLPIF